jgi:hypothetical protein
MRLYSGLSTDFIRDTVHNRIAEKLKDAFFRAVSQFIDDAKLHDHGILLEYLLPMTSKRLDCTITGQDDDRGDFLHPSAPVGQYPQLPRGLPHRLLRTPEPDPARRSCALDELT